MRLVTRREVIRSVAARWFKHYGRHDPSHTFPDGLTVGEVNDRVRALDVETCTKGDVDATGAIGFADNTCDECDTDHEALVRFGSEPGYDMRWQDLCADCLTKASTMLQSELSK